MLGIRPGHVGPGSGTWIMPASGLLRGTGDAIEVSTLAEAALTGVAMSTVPPGFSIKPITLDLNNFRLSRPQAGNLLARARVVNASQFFTFTEVQIEDPLGRQIAYGSSHAEIRKIDPPPPAPPSELRRVEEPSYATPDPWKRTVSGRLPPADIWGREDGWKIMQQFAAGEFITPYQMLADWRFVKVAPGNASATARASDWLCLFSKFVSSGVLSSILNGAAWNAGLTMQRAGQSFVGLTQSTRFFRPLLADGRLMRIESTCATHERNLLFAESHLYDADDRLIASHSGVGASVETAKRHSGTPPESKRILCTLLFTDIVNSTGHAERLGDARWKALLDEHHAKIRAEISRCEGIEVKTSGDGFLVRFASPANALECARAVRDSVRSLGIEIRAGLHTGECEMQGHDLAGMAVHIAARIEARAGASEILVSRTVKDLVIGSEMRFAEAGEHELKGVPGVWQLYAVAE